MQKQDPLNIVVLDENNNPTTLKQVLGKPIVLYFYPKDATPGCTAEACSFQEKYLEIQKAGATLIGVSADPITSHQKFREKHGLMFPLWSDPEHKLISAFGATKNTPPIGKLFPGIQRMTVLLDSEGKSVKVWNPVTNPAEHPAEVVSFLKERE